MYSPRPILKRSQPDHGQHHGPHCAVHFPPSPSLTTHTFSVYSAAAYDRSPIVVSPNSCALPERGGRTYSLDDDRSRYGDLHPRAFPRSIYPPPGLAHPPPLVPDLSSESEESDAVASPHLDSTHAPPSSHLHGLAIPQNKSSALSFLPHPPSPPSRSSYPYKSSSDDDPKLRRPRERKYEGSYDLGRIPSDGQQAIMSRKKKSRVCNSLSVCNLTSNFRLEDDGCLGGF